MKIAITGRPDIGKSTMLKIIECEFPRKVLTQGDSLNALNSEIFPEENNFFNRCARQKALYHVQFELENVLSELNPEKLILCDHGSLDLLALWPDTAESFFKELNTTVQRELDRYDWVLQINGIEKKFRSPDDLQPFHNPRDYWQNHPRFLEIPMHKGFSFSYMQTGVVVKGILSGRSHLEIQEALSRSASQTNSNGFFKINQEFEL